MTDEQIISELGFDVANEAVKQSLIENVRATVDIRAGAVVDEMLTDDQRAEFERLQAAGDNQAVWEWLRNSVLGADMSEVYESTLAAYLDELKAQQAAL